MTKHILSIILIATLLGSNAELGATGDKNTISPPPKVVGGVLALKTDFDIYKIRHGNRKPHIYSYDLMPAPEAGIDGPELDYLGRMPAGTLWEIVSAERGRRGKGKLKLAYKVKPISKIKNKIKENISREASTPDVSLEDQVFSLSSIGFGLGIYAKDDYPDGSPKLNTTWFEIIKTNAQLNN